MPIVWSKYKLPAKLLAPTRMNKEVNPANEAPILVPPVNLTKLKVIPNAPIEAIAAMIASERLYAIGVSILVKMATVPKIRYPK